MKLLAPSTVLAVSLTLGCHGLRAAPPEYPAIAHRDPEPTVEPAQREPLHEPVFVEAPSTSPVVTLRVTFDTGSSDDPLGLEGLTSLTAQLMADGAAGTHTRVERVLLLDPIAAELDVQVGRDQTVFIARVHRDHLDTVAGLLEDSLARPRFEEGDLERLRDQARTTLEARLRAGNDEALGKELLQAMLYEGHPYGHPEVGTATGLRTARVEHVRAQYEELFCGGRARVGLAGGYPESLRPRLEALLQGLTRSACAGRERLTVRPRDTSPRAIVLDQPGATSVAVSIGNHLEVRRGDPDYAALVLAFAWLGQHRQFIGQLMQEIREVRGMNYGDYAYAEHFVQEGGSAFAQTQQARRQQYFSLWLRPLRPEQAHFGIRLAIDLLRRFVEHGLTDEDVSAVRAYLDGYLALGLQTESRRLGSALDDSFAGADRPWLTALQADLRTLDAATVNAAIRRHVDLRGLQFAIVAPNATDLAQRLVANTPSPMTYAPGRTLPPSVLEHDARIVALDLGLTAERATVLPAASMFERASAP